MDNCSDTGGEFWRLGPTLTDAAIKQSQAWKS